MIFDGFDGIRVINLPYRTDRRRQMLGQLRKVGLDRDPRVSFFPAIRPDGRGPFSTIGYHGSYLSHLQILKEVPDGQSVLILEDDCDFSDEARAYRPPANFDIFYGGYYPSDADSLHEAGIVGAHCMGFRAQAVKLAARYLEGLLDLGTPGEPTAAKEPGYNPTIRPPIDGAYVWLRRTYPQLKTIFAEPAIAYQRASRTDTGALAFYDRTPGLRLLAGLAREMKAART